MLRKKQTNKPPIQGKAPVVSDESDSVEDEHTEDSLIEVEDFYFSYDLGKTDTLKDINLAIPKHRVTAFIGPSGCGKSTMLRCFNRMNDTIATAKITRGTVKIMGKDVNGPRVDPIKLRKQIGMVFQKANPFPKSIYENIAFGLRIAGIRKKAEIDEIVEESLNNAALWDELKDRLKEPAQSLSVGQQQRLCIARTVAVKPHIILMDEPCTSLDPASTAAIEELITNLSEKFTIIIATHNMQQATRVSDHTAFFCEGELIEYDLTSKLYTNPASKQTEDYIRGRFG